ncbi:MAG: hypothetical protein ACJA1A_003029 [Saprospiraceae bacterium]|jgi:hypothetical protein|tara:strand:- start:429 stop:1553 length:1125 start_codon:yes stop_codon:yes gene_type:complete
MKYLYKITLIFIVAITASNLIAQDIQFSYVAVPNGDNTTTVTYCATNTGGVIEELGAFTIDFYYDDNETSVMTVDFSPVSGAPWNWGTANQTITNHQAVNNPSVPITHTGYFVYQNFDNNFTGVNLNPGEKFTLGTVVFNNADNKPNDGGEGFIETSVEQPGLKYSGIDGGNFIEHDVFTNGAQQQILPIVIRSFTATKGEKSVNLDWSTSSEINGSHFDVQRSQNLSDWTTIGTVKAVGESGTEQNYDLLDNELPLSTRSSKTFYYRLNMVDNDGAAELSEVRTVRFDVDGAEFIVYPNPSFNEVFVNLSSITTETGPATMNVINMKGERVKDVTLSTNDDISVDVSTLTAGVYYFVVRQGEDTFTQKVIKID